MRRLLAVLGKDVSRSLSPKLHAAAAAQCALDVAYVPVSCPTPEKFHKAIDALRELEARGANVTIPYKRDAYERATILTDTAKEIGAVNTLTFESDQEIEGDNTDGPALVALLHDKDLTRAQILGGGGAARAAAWALAKSGAREIFVCARSPAEGHEGGQPEGRSPTIVPRSRSDRYGQRPLAPIEGATFVISTLPPDPELAERVLRECIDLTSRPELLDISYRADGPPPLVTLAAQRGLTATDGRAMLVEQAARSLARWTGGELSRIRDAMYRVFAG